MTEIDIQAHDCSEGLCCHCEHQKSIAAKLNDAQKSDAQRARLASIKDPKVLKENFEVNNSEEAHMYEATRFDD